MTTEKNNLKLTAEQIRRRLVNVVYGAKAGHIGGGLSSVNMLTVLYFHTLRIDPKQPKWADRDRFVMSKGHCVEALYSTLEARGYLPDGLLDTYGQPLSLLAGHPTVEVPGVEVNSGALGHGLGIGVGMALSAKRSGKAYRTFVLMGDGEQGEGSIYEAAMAASHYRLDNLVAIIDRNRLQISGTTEEVMSLEPIRQRWESFGWEVVDVNGDEVDDIAAKFDALNCTNGKPTLVISHTTKGFGVSLMENVLKWHHGVPSESEYQQAIAEIEARIAQLQAN